MQYDVVTDYYLGTLIIHVNEKLIEGWTLLGAPIYIEDSDMKARPGSWYQFITKVK